MGARRSVSLVELQPVCTLSVRRGFVGGMVTLLGHQSVKSRLEARGASCFDVLRY